MIERGMLTNLLWRGTEYHSLENCVVSSNEKGCEIDSVVVGFYQDKIYRVAYKIKTTVLWETLSIELVTKINGECRQSRFESDKKGNWIVNGKSERKFAGCIDVDISLTPFTNTLPINRLNLAINDEKVIEVLYCDLLQNEFSKVSQKYIRLSDTVYRFQNVPNDFEAAIEVDENGFIVDYPRLFVRTAIDLRDD